MRTVPYSSFMEREGTITLKSGCCQASIVFNSGDTPCPRQDCSTGVGTPRRTEVHRGCAGDLRVRPHGDPVPPPTGQRQWAFPGGPPAGGHRPEQRRSGRWSGSWRPARTIRARASPGSTGPGGGGQFADPPHDAPGDLGNQPVNLGVPVDQLGPAHLGLEFRAPGPFDLHRA